MAGEGEPSPRRSVSYIAAQASAAQNGGEAPANGSLGAAHAAAPTHAGTAATPTTTTGAAAIAELNGGAHGETDAFPDTTKAAASDTVRGAKGDAPAGLESGHAEGPPVETDRLFGPHRSSLVGRYLLWWNVGLLRFAWSHTMTPDDLPALHKRFWSEGLSARADRCWAREQERNPDNPSLIWAMLNVLSHQYKWGYLLGGIDGLLTCVARPLLIRELIETIQNGTPASSADTAWLMCAMMSLLLIEGWAGVYYRHLLIEDCGSTYVAALFALLLKKILRSSASEVQQDALAAPADGDGDGDDGPDGAADGKSGAGGTDASSDGGKSASGVEHKPRPTDLEAPESNEVAMFGNDLIRSYNMMMWASGVPIAITGIIGGAAVLFYLVGWVPALCGLGVAAAILAINFFLTVAQGKVEHSTLGLADVRMSIVTQIVETIRAVKFFAWEPEYLERITGVRLRECRKIRVGRMLHATSVGLGRTSPVIAAAVAILAYRYTGNKLRTSDVFAVVTAFQSMRLPLIMAPLGMSALEAVAVSLKRLHGFLVRPDHFGVSAAGGAGGDGRGESDAPVPGERKAAVSPVVAAEAAVPSDDDVVVELDSVSFSWSTALREDGSPPPDAVSGVSLAVRRGELVAICGPVGGGKSTLLHGLIGELRPTAGAIRRRVTKEQTGFASQRAFILSGTVRENILFGRPVARGRMRHALEVSAFLKDLDLLPAGDRTEIGERGTTLSGGQQQRLSIARALYSDPALLVLDDPLSAVDSQVCNHIFDRAILSDPLADPERSVVMVLNQVHLLPHFDRVLFVENGCVTASGSYDEVASTMAYKAWVEDIAEHEGGRGSPDGGSEKGAAAVDDADVEARGAPPGRHSMPAAALLQQLAAEEEAQRRGHVDSPASPASTDGGEGDDADASNGGGGGGDHVRLLADEKRSTGRVSAAVVSQFIRQMGRLSFYFTGVMVLVAYTCVSFSDIWLGMWAESSQREPDGELSRGEDTRYAAVYGGAMIVLVTGVLSGSYSFCFAGERVSNRLHAQCMTRLLYAPYSWFLETPVGRITSRFSSDLAAVDLYLTFWVDNMFQLGSSLVVFTVTVMVLVPPVIVLIVICIPVFALIVEAVDRSNREMKRMSNAAMGPVLSNVQEALHGRVLARAMGLEHYFVERHHRLVDAFNRATYATWCLMSWMQWVAAATSALVSFAVMLLALRSPSSENSVDTMSVAVMYSFLIPYYLAFVAQILSMVKMYFASYERVNEYLTLPQEPPRTLETDPPPGTWPTAGAIEFDHVSMRYRDGLPLAISDLSARIGGGQKVGVVGRTGAGKSSLAAVLFRLVEVTGGRVLVDGVDVATVGLRTLRKAITVIPQDPTLMEGTVRENLDPFGRCTDKQVRDALAKASLDPALAAHRLSKGGDNMSAGQRQLLCFARAVLHRAPIIIMDEPTANCDQVTDAAIQRMVRNTFAGSTLFTIAHRLRSIIDFDLVLVMDKGRCVELAPPHELLQVKRGHFSRMVDALGKEGAELRRLAAAAAAARAAETKKSV